MSFVDVDQKLSPVVDDAHHIIAYRVQVNVLRGVGIDANLFVYRVNAPESFQYVAALYDLKKWPSDINIARAQGLDFYRASSIDVTYQDGALAQVAASDVLRRIKLVVHDWDNQPGAFPSETIVTIQGTTP